MPAQGQIYGVIQGNMASGSRYNYGVSSVHDYTVYPYPLRLFWSCGATASFCYGENAAYVGIDIVSSNYGFCDSSDPSVVKFNGSYYMYITAIPAGDFGCTYNNGSNNRIYAFGSSDARHWTLLNNGNPVIWNGVTSSYGTGQPSAIVLSYGYSCQGGQWSAYPASPFVRVYYTQFGNEPNFPNHLYAMDSYDGITFTPHTDNFGNQAILSGTNITVGGWYPSVKKIGLVGDYPLAMTYVFNTGSAYTAVTHNGPSDFSWTGGNGGAGLPLAPNAEDVHLEGDSTAVFMSTLGGAFSGAPTGQINLWWSRPHTDSNIYLGQADTATWFPWSTSLGSCQ